MCTVSKSQPPFVSSGAMPVAWIGVKDVILRTPGFLVGKESRGMASLHLWQLCSRREIEKLKSRFVDLAAALTRQNSSQYPLRQHYASKNDETDSSGIELCRWDLEGNAFPRSRGSRPPVRALPPMVAASNTEVTLENPQSASYRIERPYIYKFQVRNHCSCGAFGCSWRPG